MKNLNSYWLFLFLIIPSILIAQRKEYLKLNYNYYDNEIDYQLNNKLIEKPYAKHGTSILVKISEFNHYTHKVRLEIGNGNYNEYSPDYSINSAFSTARRTSSFSGILDMVGNFTIGGSIADQFFNIPVSRGRMEQEEMQYLKKFKALSSELIKIEQNLEAIMTKINMIASVEESKMLAFADIQKLKGNKNIKPSRLKELIEEEIYFAFTKEKGVDITIKDLVNKNNTKGQLTYSVEQYKLLIENYANVLIEWQILQEEGYQIIHSENRRIQFALSGTDSIINKMEGNIIDFNEKSVNVEGYMEEEDIDISDEVEEVISMGDLRQTYEELQSQGFNYSFPPIQAVGDEIKLKLIFSTKNENGEYEENKTYMETIPIKGAWKVTPGVGLAFAVFAKERLNFDIRNNLIISEPLDDFLPMIASFVHFYKTSPKDISFGGSFGIGLPVNGGDNIQAASFFLGPTMLIGQAQNVVLSAGVMGAKNQRLSRGLNIGDSFDSVDGVLPTRNIYELGYFLGISFNFLR